MTTSTSAADHGGWARIVAWLRTGYPAAAPDHGQLPLYGWRPTVTEIELIITELDAGSA